ncbi:MAG TPA: DUF748 domain-containing protein [Cyclobacteriaceae bacterium]|nr:DUF748 domain-containing protein [Cyclobacteriaceae bacterium]
MKEKRDRTKTTKSRRSLFALLLVILVVPVYFIGRAIIFSRIEKAIISQLEVLRLEGVLVQYDSMKTDWWKQTVVITGLEVKVNGTKDSLSFAGATIPTASLKGIKFLPLLLKHELHFDAIFLDHPALRAMNDFRMPARQKETKENFIQGIRIGLLRIDSGAVELIDSTSHGSIATVHLSLDSRNLSIHFINKGSPTWTIGEVMASDVKASFPTHSYNMTIKQARYSDVEKILNADSIQISPLYDKAEFARRAGRQIDQFSCSIPVIQATGFEIGKTQPGRPSSYAVHQVNLRFRLEAFRDKRIPRETRTATVLPVHFLQELPFQLQIDTLAVSDSYVSYEEFPQKGEASGKVFFNGLQAGITNISNTSSQGATMRIHTRFMNSGDLNATFTCPAEAQKPYTVKGSLSNFSMPEINPMMVAVAHAQFESGEMQEMKFHFQYNEYRSDGEVELSYTNLKVRRLKKNQEILENKLVSFLVNMFVKDDLDKSDTREKRTGSIQMVRDSQRGIFNYWWKSVFSGVKSVYHGKGNGHRKQKGTAPVAGI